MQQEEKQFLKHIYIGLRPAPAPAPLPVRMPNLSPAGLCRFSNCGGDTAGPLVPAELDSQPQESGPPGQGYRLHRGPGQMSTSTAPAALLPVFLSTGNLLQDNLWDTMGSFLRS